MNIFSKKTFKYFYLMLLRQTESPEIIAKSAAIGLFIGFFFPIGFQIPAVLILGYIFRAKKILSFIFTLPTNVYTVIFIYPVQCWLGGKILGIPLKFSTLMHTFKGVINDFSFANFLELGIEVVISFFAGGLLLGIISGVIGYFTVYGMIISYRENKRKRELLKNQKEKSTEQELKDKKNIEIP